MPLLFVTTCPYDLNQLFVICDLCLSLLLPFSTLFMGILNRTDLQIPEISAGTFPLLSEMPISSLLCFLPLSHFSMPGLPPPAGSLVLLKSLC